MRPSDGTSSAPSPPLNPEGFFWFRAFIVCECVSVWVCVCVRKSSHPSGTFLHSSGDPHADTTAFRSLDQPQFQQRNNGNIQQQQKKMKNKRRRNIQADLVVDLSRSWRHKSLDDGKKWKTCWRIRNRGLLPPPPITWFNTKSSKQLNIIVADWVTDSRKRKQI